MIRGYLLTALNCFRLQFNGHHGCSWCYAYGDHLDGSMRYPFKYAESEIRTNKSHKKDAKEASSLNSGRGRKKIVRGVKGESSLSGLLHFDLVWGFPVDLLHGICLGVVKQLCRVWMKGKGKEYYLGPAAVKKINVRITKCRTPSDFHRDFRPFGPRTKHKGAEWFIWLMAVGIPCLIGILPDKYVSHFSILTKSIYLLSTEHVSKKKCLKIYKELLIFVGYCQYYYGKSFMTFNVHSLAHLPYSVLMSGPLWASSTAPAESFMYQLQQKQCSPKGVDKQIIRRFLLNNIMKYTVLPKMEKNKLCSKFVESVLYKKSIFDPKDKSLIELTNPKVVDDTEEYHRCVYAETTYTSLDYSNQLKKNDSAVIFNDGTTGQILNFSIIDENVYVTAEKIYKDDLSNTIKLPHMYRVTAIGPELIVKKMDEIKRKCAFFEIENNTKYICLVPECMYVQ